MRLKAGKLDNETLKRIVIDKIKYKSEEVAIKAGIGEDCAYLDFDKDYCVISTDPITASVEDIGRLAVHVCYNDVAATGTKAFCLFLAVMLPVGSALSDVERIMEQAAGEAEKLQVEIAGGHTEVTPAVNRPVIVATAIGKAPKDQTLAREGIRVGDKLIVTKSLGLEGTALIATDYAERLTGLTKEEIASARRFAEQTDVVTEGVIAGKLGVSAMHDVTEGGIEGAVWELCQVAQTGAVLMESVIPVEPVTRKICQAVGIDWRKLISSGAMLIVVRPDKAETMLDNLAEAGVPATLIGEMVPKEQGITMEEKATPQDVPGAGKRRPIAPPTSDEIYKVVRQR